ncbi:hypothetical protein FHX06_002037 [Rhizobium sp. BK512]|jgi:hypothetical protein|uniref:DUF4231 domain-containing protein n=1 Tax=Rhizobium sp. BK512 TaxID=2587010 RepID=UPI000DD59A0B|nr:DUF4231 domain-containing protein [Rhizobium sp. BK512]MBB3560726.1 hypothetical protein [Rhizobium sp. BK512]
MSEPQILSPIAVPASKLTPDQIGYDEQEDRLLRIISESLDYYRKQIEKAGKWHRRLTVSTMVLSLLAPVFVAGSAAADALKIPGAALGVIGVLITLAIAIIEGVKQIYKFGDQWSSAYTAKLAIRRARDEYKFNRIGLVPGDDAWKQNYHSLRAAYESASNAQTQDFFRTLQQPDK